MLLADAAGVTPLELLLRGMPQVAARVVLDRGMSTAGPAGDVVMDYRFLLPAGGGEVGKDRHPLMVAARSCHPEILSNV